MWGGGQRGGAQRQCTGQRKKKKDIQSEICVEGLSLSYIYIHIVCVCDMNPAQQEGSDKPSWAKKNGIKSFYRTRTCLDCCSVFSLSVYMVGSAFTIN